ncbi:hypothetical protein JOL62DRAFT_616001 [Phyllosticta paracitricarpa]|uniref:Uncharacterized protein n=1 Tax=Phyllosticta paracitricarpa TaxID=2016321 RepID=A0ABR1MY23_9PEZI
MSFDMDDDDDDDFFDIDDDESIDELTQACSSLPIRPKKLLSSSPSAASHLIIGAGSRGRAYAKAISRHTACVIAAVAEPIEYKRKKFARDLIEPPQRESHQGRGGGTTQA